MRNYVLDQHNLKVKRKTFPYRKKNLDYYETEGITRKYHLPDIILIGFDTDFSLNFLSEMVNLWKKGIVFTEGELSYDGEQIALTSVESSKKRVIFYGKKNFREDPVEDVREYFLNDSKVIAFASSVKEEQVPYADTIEENEFISVRTDRIEYGDIVRTYFVTKGLMQEYLHPEVGIIGFPKDLSMQFLNEMVYKITQQGVMLSTKGRLEWEGHPLSFQKIPEKMSIFFYKVLSDEEETLIHDYFLGTGNEEQMIQISHALGVRI